MPYLILNRNDLTAPGQADTEQSREGLCHLADIFRIDLLRLPAYGIQCIVEEMWVDLRLQRLQDVYKRQVLETVGNLYEDERLLHSAKLMKKQIALCSFTGTLFCDGARWNGTEYINMEAVSYTHLDVYKRQEYHLSPSHFWDG